MSERLPGLVVELEAKIDKLERGLAKANRAQGNAADHMERRARQSADRMNASYGNSADKIAAGFVRMGAKAGAALGVITAAAGAGAAAVDRVARGIAETGDAARRAGLDFETFQRLEFVARQNRIGLDAMTDGLKELQLRADEFIQTGSGSGAEAFRRLGFASSDLKRRLEDPAELFLEIIGRLEDLDKAAQIRVADEVFGGSGGERFVELLAQGEAGVRATMQRAEDLGLVLGDDVLSQAERVNQKFEELRQRAAALGKQVVVSVAGALEDALTVDIDEIFGSTERAIAMLGEDTYKALSDPTAFDAQRRKVEALIDTWDELREAIAATTGPDGLRLMDAADLDAGQELAAIMTDIDAAMNAFDSGAISADEFTDQMIELTGEAEDAAAALAAIDEARFSSVVSGIGGIVTALNTAIERAGQLGRALPGEGAVTLDAAGPRNGRRVAVDIRPGQFAPTSSPRPQLPGIDSSFGVPTPDSAGGGGGGGRADDYAREAAALRELTREAELEAAALVAVAAAGRDLSGAIDDAARKAELLHAALRSGRTDTPELRQEIDGLVAAHRRQADAVDQVRDRLDDVQSARDQLRDGAENAFSGLVAGTLTWRDALSQVFAQLAQMASSRLFQQVWGGTAGTAGGGFLGFLGGLLGFSGGGYTGPGGRFEPAGIVHRDEFVFSKPAVQRLGVGALEGMHSAALSGTPVFAGTGTGTSVNISAPITVNGSAGTPEQNADLARQMRREMEQTMRGLVATEIRSAMRPGNVLNRR